MCGWDEEAQWWLVASKRGITLEPKRQIMRMPRFFERGLVALCAVSLFVYLLHSQAAEKYLALYVTVLSKLPMILGK